jgi:hypothetical protein
MAEAEEQDATSVLAVHSMKAASCCMHRPPVLMCLHDQAGKWLLLGMAGGAGQQLHGRFPPPPLLEPLPSAHQVPKGVQVGHTHDVARLSTHPYPRPHVRAQHAGCHI